MTQSILFVLLASAALCGAQEESSAKIENPYNTDLDRELGAKIFLSQCASCHGRDGKGGQGTPDLTRGNFRRATSDEGLFQVIAKGVPGTTMPAFSLEARPIWQLVAHIRSLSFHRPVHGGAGNKAKGAELYLTFKCAGCHENTAPNLQETARHRSSIELRRSIEEPDFEVASAYWRIKITMRDGRTFTGRRMNEDTHSVQFLDDKGMLRGVSKADAARIEVIRNSPMPAFRGKLTEDQMSDLLAFIAGGAQ